VRAANEARRLYQSEIRGGPLSNKARFGGGNESYGRRSGELKSAVNILVRGGFGGGGRVGYKRITPRGERATLGAASPYEDSVIEKRRSGLLRTKHKKGGDQLLGRGEPGGCS